jgi:hypothetical protein
MSQSTGTGKLAEEKSPFPQKKNTGRILNMHTPKEQLQKI